ncbi:ABC transporter substrate-binding protein [Microbacterium sp. SORGH_AS_0888]|uniref:ABC transporter substrate-binding protein n=1 Tax=Microbacterium sp. SORGH_AS_0888 TaxID=3041791 RepID=UPI00278391F6|nr:ABC transporter substrate-binding protein [Microbacterium sp. SORGH_AS_0888]MDQ1128216.1 peptide/nickel transport system substrate-binding protein [Microbacterium sp. SORGH_AS_0888]
MRDPRLATRITAILVTAGALTALTGCFAGGATGSAAATAERISVAMLQPPRSGLSPLSDDAFKLSRWSTAETLVTLDDDATAQPSLATSWTRIDDTSWRFAIRPGVTFHDGTTLTADAVVNALQQAAQASPVPRILKGVGLQARADGDAVVVTTASVDPLLPQRLSSPQLSILAPAAYDGDIVSPVGTGTGPFRLVAVNGISGATLDRYDDYWGGTAKAAGIDVSFVPDGTARTAALRTGAADIVEAVPAGQVATIDPQLAHEVPMPRTNTLYLNTASGPFADPGVRAAARAAIDRAAIISSVYEGRADEAKGLLGPALPWTTEARGSAEYEALLEARALPAQVDKVAITLGTFTDRAELPEVAVLVQQQLEKAGFVVTQDVREYQFIEADALAGRFDAFILSRATVLDSGDPVAYFAADFGCQGGFSIAQLCDPAVDTAITAASQTAAGQERQRAILAAEARILATDAAVPMLHERVVQGESRRVHEVARDPRERTLVTVDTWVEATTDDAKR